MDALREGDAQEIVDKAVSLAKAGNVRMATTLINKLYPTPRFPAIELEVPEGQEADPRAILGAALRAMCAGLISGEEAFMVARTIEKAAKLLLDKPDEVRVRKSGGPRPAAAAKPAPQAAKPASRRHPGQDPAPGEPPAEAAPANRQYLARDPVPEEAPAEVGPEAAETSAAAGRPAPAVQATAPAPGRTLPPGAASASAGEGPGNRQYFRMSPVEAPGRQEAA
jgi:hypothetical protein